MRLACGWRNRGGAKRAPAARSGGTRAVYTATYASADALQQVLGMGMVEGATSAINQIDALLTG